MCLIEKQNYISRNIYCKNKTTYLAIFIVKHIVKQNYIA